MRKMTFAFLLFAGWSLPLALHGCGTPAEGPGAPYQRIVDSVSALTAGLEIPMHLFDPLAQKRGGEFDPMAFFTILKNVSLPPGVTLDYVYQFAGSAGHPLLYLRKSGQPPFRNLSEFLQAPSRASRSREERLQGVLRSLSVRETESGFFEFAVFFLVADHFYLYKWARDDRRIVCTREAVGKAMEAERVSDETKAKALALDPAPGIRLLPDRAEITLVTFSPGAGLTEERITVSRPFPHSILSHEREGLATWENRVLR